MKDADAAKIERKVGQHRYYDGEGLYMIASSDGKIIFESDKHIENRKKIEEKMKENLK